MTEHRCCVEVRDQTRMIRFHQCLRRGVLNRHGKWYCMQHDPMRKQTQELMKDAEFAAARARRNFEYAAVDMARTLQDIATNRTMTLTTARSKALAAIRGLNFTALRVPYKKVPS